MRESFHGQGPKARATKSAPAPRHPSTSGWREAGAHGLRARPCYQSMVFSTVSRVETTTGAAGSQASRAHRGLARACLSPVPVPTFSTPPSPPRQGQLPRDDLRSAFLRKSSRASRPFLRNLRNLRIDPFLRVEMTSPLAPMVYALYTRLPLSDFSRRSAPPRGQDSTRRPPGGTTVTRRLLLAILLALFFAGAARAAEPCRFVVMGDSHPDQNDSDKIPASPRFVQAIEESRLPPARVRGDRGRLGLRLLPFGQAGAGARRVRRGDQAV